MSKQKTKPDKLSIHQLRELMNQGQRMSNWMYNVVQLRECPKHWAAEMKLMVEAWDTLRRGEKHLLRTRRKAADV